MICTRACTANLDGWVRVSGMYRVAGTGSMAVSFLQASMNARRDKGLQYPVPCSALLEARESTHPIAAFKMSARTAPTYTNPRVEVSSAMGARANGNYYRVVELIHAFQSLPGCPDVRDLCSGPLNIYAYPNLPCWLYILTVFMVIPTGGVAVMSQLLVFYLLSKYQELLQSVSWPVSVYCRYIHA